MTEWWRLALFVLCFPPGYGGLAVMGGSILREYFGRDLFPRMLGIMPGFSSIGGIVGPTMTGWIFDSYGTYHLIWFSSIGILFLSIVMILGEI